jgi:hypothetical protein
MGASMSQVQIQEGVVIENPRKYDSGAIENLRRLLQSGTAAERDPRRENFYEVDGNEESYYIHVSPISGNVVLLARWNTQPDGCSADAACCTA